jgi:hypothetical protein
MGAPNVLREEAGKFCGDLSRILRLVVEIEVGRPLNPIKLLPLLKGHLTVNLRVRISASDKEYWMRRDHLDERKSKRPSRIHTVV